jgi:hypothetical protein
MGPQNSSYRIVPENTACIFNRSYLKVPQVIPLSPAPEYRVDEVPVQIILKDHSCLAGPVQLSHAILVAAPQKKDIVSLESQ